MNKENILKHLRDAKKGHIRWVEHAYALIRGIPLDKDQVPLQATECAFGQWYFGEGQVFSQNKVFADMKAKHAELHGIYMEIFQILFSPIEKKKSFFEKFFNQSAKVEESEKTKALEYYRNLEKVSNELVKYIEVLETQVINMSDEDLKKLI